MKSLEIVDLLIASLNRMRSETVANHSHVSSYTRDWHEGVIAGIDLAIFNLEAKKELIETRQLFDEAKGK